MNQPTPIELLEERLTEYRKALRKSNEAHKQGLIESETHQMHRDNLLPLINRYEKAIKKLNL